MCDANRSGIWLAIGMVMLGAAVLLPEVIHLTGQSGHNLLHAARGLLMGMSIGLNFMVVVRGRRCRRPANS